MRQGSQERLKQQLGQRPDDAVGPGRRIGWQALPIAVVPDRMDAETLRRRHFPFEIVADHPGLSGFDAERVHGVGIGALFGFAESVLALDLNMVEPLCESKPDNLGPLRRS